MREDGSFSQEAKIPTEIVARLEVAERGSRELDQAVHEALGLPGQWSGPINPPRAPQGVWSGPHYTHFVDAALALAERVLGHCFWQIDHSAIISGQRRYSAMLPPEAPTDGEGEAATAPLALCIAILKATNSGKPSSASEGVGT